MPSFTTMFFDIVLAIELPLKVRKYLTDSSLPLANTGY
jgi:hypothetical protein